MEGSSPLQNDRQKSTKNADGVDIMMKPIPRFTTLEHKRRKNAPLGRNTYAEWKKEKGTWIYENYVMNPDPNRKKPMVLHSRTQRRLRSR